MLVLCSVDDLFLRVPAQFHKIGAVSGHPYHKVPMIFRLLLGLDQCLCVDHVKLHMFSAIGQVYLQKVGQLLHVFGAL